MRGVAARADLAEAHRGFGNVLFLQHRVAEAATEYRKALAIDPNMPVALIELAWILSSTDNSGVRNPLAALSLAERAADLTYRKDASVLDTLAVAYMANAQAARAIETAEAALALASEAGDQELVKQLTLRLEFYRQKQ